MTTEHTTRLLSRINDGDRDAENQLFGRLMQEFRDVARRILSRFSRPSIDVDELVSEFYIKSFKTLGAKHFNSSEHLICVAYVRMYWHIHDVLKRQNMLQPETHQLTNEALTGTGIATRVANDNLIEIVWAELETLPDELRVVVQHRLTGGMTYQQIASELDVAPSTAHARFEEAIRRLRALVDLGEHNDE